MARPGYVDFAYEIGADGKPYNPLNGARHYGSLELVLAKQKKWEEWRAKYLTGNGKKSFSQEAFEAHCLETNRMNEEDRKLHPELW